MNCHECIHAGELPWNAHIQCAHPGLAGGLNFIAALMVLKTGGFPPFGVGCSPHGISHGWCNWPLEFDPVWLDSCDQFQRKVVINDEKETATQ